MTIANPPDQFTKAPQAAVNGQTLKRSPPCSALKVSKRVQTALQRLCSMKTSVQLTPHQLDTWGRVLSCYFPEDIVIRTVIEFGLTDDPFPDIGKLIQRCQRIQADHSPDYAPGRDFSKPPSRLVDSVLMAFGLLNLPRVRKEMPV